jgi:hypothetical protein
MKCAICPFSEEEDLKTAIPIPVQPDIQWLIDSWNDAEPKQPWVDFVPDNCPLKVKRKDFDEVKM